MTKKEIVKTISEEIGMTQLKTKEIVQKTFDAIVESLVTEKRIELRNFGVFEVKTRAARKARNPRTGQRVDVPEKWVVTFKPGKEMEEKVRQAEQREVEAKEAASQQTGTQAGTQQAGTQQAGTQQAGTQQAGTQQAGPQQAGPQQTGTPQLPTTDASSSPIQSQPASQTFDNTGYSGPRN